MVETKTSGSVEEGEAATARKATERLTFFSDAVVAIAITLLAIFAVWLVLPMLLAAVGERTGLMTPG